LPKGPFKPEADFEKDPEYARIIEKLREVEDEKLSEDFEENLFKKLETVTPRKPVLFWLSERLSTLISRLWMSRIRFAVSVALVVLVLGGVSYLLLQRGVKKTPYWEQAFRDLSRQQTYSFINEKEIPKEFEESGGTPKGKINDLSTLKFFRPFGAANLLQKK
jgi:hypothetical protein